MKIGGVQKLSLVDYPGKIAAAIFTLGCNMRCGYCHNPELVLPERFNDTIPEEDILLFLQSRIGKLEALVISGGEPTMHQDLPQFARQVKDLGFLVKLDTNGTNPQMVQQMIEQKLIDFVAMDIKGPFSKYQQISAFPIDVQAVAKTIELLKSSDLAYEFRTTVVRQQLSFEDFDSIGQVIQGAPRFALQKFRSGKTLSPAFAHFSTYNDAEFLELKKRMENYVDECVIH